MGPRVIHPLLFRTTLLVACGAFAGTGLLGVARFTSAQDATAALSARMSLGGVSVSAFPSRRPQSRIRFGADRAVRVCLSRELRDEFDRAARRTTITVCGAPAVRTERTFDALPSERVTIDGQHMVTPPRPRMTYVRVALRHDGRRYVVEWAVRSGRRAALRALEEAFFASIHCE